MKFHEKRRQQFLPETAYLATRKILEEVSGPRLFGALSRPDFNAQDRANVSEAYADTVFLIFMLKYTGGEALATLRQELENVVAAHERAAGYIREYRKRPNSSPLRFAEIDEYERVLQIISLCFLLHRRDLLPRVAKMFDPTYADRDTLYEDLLAFAMDGRFLVNHSYHEIPYKDLINSIYQETDEAGINDIKNYLNNWYKSLSRAPWHDSHLNIEGENCAGYFGYWAIEAAAVAYLMDLDDSSFREHLVYPKDLVDFARKMDQLAEQAQPNSNE